MNRYRVSGGPDWLSTDRFNIEAEAEGNPGREETMLMLQALLADRFQLKVHREVHDGRVYALLIAKGGRSSSPQPVKIRIFFFTGTIRETSRA